MTDHTQQFASDNYSGICPEAWAAMAEANRGHERAYGDDQWTARASDYFRQLFETDCEVFFAFNGTAANSLALAALCQSYHSVICSETAHVETDECGAPEFFSNGSKLLLAQTEVGKLTPASIRDIALKRQDIHYPKPRVVTLTQATEVGTVYRPDELKAISATCKELGLHLHMDGARFSNACGQLASKMRFLAAPWVGVLQDDAWLRYADHANRCARLLAELVADVPGVSLMFPVEANGVFLQLSEPAIEALRARGWRFYTFIGEGGARFMCSWDTDIERVRELARDIRLVMGA